MVFEEALCLSFQQVPSILGQITNLLELTKQFILSFCSLGFSALCISASYLQTNSEDGAPQQWRDGRSGVWWLFIAQSHNDKLPEMSSAFLRM